MQLSWSLACYGMIPRRVRGIGGISSLPNSPGLMSDQDWGLGQETLWESTTRKSMPFGLHSIEGRGVSRIRCLITRGKFLGVVYSIGWRIQEQRQGNQTAAVTLQRSPCLFYKCHSLRSWVMVLAREIILQCCDLGLLSFWEDDLCIFLQVIVFWRSSAFSKLSLLILLVS